MSKKGTLLRIGYGQRILNNQLFASIWKGYNGIDKGINLPNITNK